MSTYQKLEKWNIKELVVKLARIEAVLNENRKLLLLITDLSEVIRITSEINANSCKAHRLRKMIDNIKDGQPAFGFSDHIHNVTK